MPRIPAGRIIAVAALLLVAFVAYLIGTTRPQVAQAAPAAGPGGPAATGTSGLEVTGTGKIAGTPDVLRLDLTVSVTRPAATAALDATNRAMAGVIRALTGRKVAGKDITTTGLSLQPEYDYSATKSVLRGYTGSENVSVTLRNLTTAGAVISAATGAGGDAARVQGVTLDLEGDSALLAKARSAAFADARTKAQGYATAAGRTLGKVTVISEEATPPSPIRLDQSTLRADASSAAPVPVQPGSQQVSVSVRVVWSLA